MTAISHCFGNNDLGQASPGSYSGPYEIAAGDNITCVIEAAANNAVRCWGHTFPIALDEIIALTVGPEVVCGTSNDPTTGSTIECFGGGVNGGAALTNTQPGIDIGVNSRQACIIDSQGKIGSCWGDTTAQNWPAPTDSLDRVRGDVLECTVEPYDGSSWGPTVSTSTIVANAPPVTTNARIVISLIPPKRQCPPP